MFYVNTVFLWSPPGGGAPGPRVRVVVLTLLTKITALDL